MKRRNNKSAPLHGFTLIELLIAVIIVAILVSMIVVVYSNRAAQARITAAQADLDSLQNAEQQIAVDTGYFFRFYALDDVPGGDGINPEEYDPATPPVDVTDGIRDEALRTTQNATDLFVDTKTGDLLPQGDSIIYTRLVQAGEVAFNFNGPYLNFSRKVGVKAPPVGQQVVGLPLDPWMGPYLFFTSKGVIDEWNGIMVQTITINGTSYNSLIFDRPTVLSLGPDGLPGSGPGTDFGEGDDIFKQF